jgi:outer membrane usher protein
VRRCCIGAPCALAALSSVLLAAEPTQEVEFNSTFLQGGSQIDVSRFSRGNVVLAGEYLVDLQINSKWVGRVSVRFVGQPDSDIAQPCIDRALLDRIELDPGKLSAAALSGMQQAGVAGCMDLRAMIEDATVAFDMSRLRLDITVPQATTLRKPRGYVGPEFWDSGVPSATLGYNINAYRSDTTGSSSTRGHVDLTSGANYGSWHLRHRSSVQVASGGSSTYQSVATYLAHDMPAIRSDLLVGDSFTDGAVFDSFGFRGASLTSSDQMLPDSQLEFAPVVRGIAHTNARVVISQNGITILETTVSPGAFVIDDLYATGYGGDLAVEVHEADGSKENFTVPYASMPQLLRPGVWRYTATAGELQQQTGTTSVRFAQATLQRGFSSFLTGYAGALGADLYSAGLLGFAINTRAGAISADITHARTDIPGANSSSGQSLRLSYSKLLRDLGTNITLATYRYSSSGFHTFADSTDPAAKRTRSQWQAGINQTLPGNWGNFYLTASQRNYWETSGTSTQMQGGYTNYFRIGSTRLSYGVAIARQNNMLTGKPDHRMQANFSLPLGRSPLSPTLSTSITQSTTSGASTRGGQEVVTGSLGESRRLSYSVSASQAAGDQAYAASVQHRGALSSTSASLSAGKGYSQQSLGATGGMVIHRGGITLSNQMTDTFGIVEARGAAGARVTNSIGTVINGAGYAVLPFLLPYRMNSISIDPEGAVSADIEFKSTTQFIAPRRNAVVLVHFETVGGRAILINARLTDGTEVPFGATVNDAGGNEVGLTGQDGRIYLRGVAETGTLTAQWGNAADEKCAFDYALPAKQDTHDPFVRIDAVCKAPAGNAEARP